MRYDKLVIFRNEKNASSKYRILISRPRNEQAMQQIFVIDGIRIELVVTYEHICAELVEATALSDIARSYISTGYRSMELEAVASNGEKVSGLFRILSRLEGDVLELESVRD